MAAPWGNDRPGIINLPAMVLIVMCALLLIRGASESATVNTIMVIIKLCVLAMFVLIAFTAFTTDHFAGFWNAGFAGITAGASTIFFTFIGLDAVSTAGDEVKDPQKTMPRAIIAALIVVTTIYILVAFAGLGTQSAGRSGPKNSPRPGFGHPGEHRRPTWASTILAAGAVISIFSVTLVVMYGQTRILFAMGRDGLLPSMFAKVNPRTMTPVNNTIIVARGHRDPGGPRPDRLPVGPGVDRHARRIHHGVHRRDHPAGPPTRPASRLQGAGLSGDTHPVLSVACGFVLYGLPPITWMWFGIWVAVVLAFYFVWSRHHSALKDGGDGLIPTAAPQEDEVLDSSAEGRPVTRRRRIPRRQGRPIGTAPRRRGGQDARRPRWWS